jgi:hypothetical protein
LKAEKRSSAMDHAESIGSKHQLLSGIIPNLTWRRRLDLSGLHRLEWQKEPSLFDGCAVDACHGQDVVPEVVDTPQPGPQ